MTQVTIHKTEDFDKMQKAGKLAASILDYIAPFVEIGVSTGHLNDLCHKKIIESAAIPAPLNYKGFPKSICTSINNVICHGIPDHKRKLKNGDILNIDVTVILDGWYGDTSRMYCVGNVSEQARKLCQVTYEAMMLGIEQVRPGNKLGDIGYAIQSHVEKNGFSVVRDYCGHGIGRVFHTEPNVVHYGKKGTGIELLEGMFFTIEPMVNVGSYQTVLNKSDNWTVSTIDGSLSAQFEHTVGVTKDGVQIFTSPSKLNSK